MTGSIDLQLLLSSPVATLLLASVVVKMLLSTFKWLTPKIGTPNDTPSLVMRWAAMLLGIAAAFIMGLGVFQMPADQVLPWYLVALNKVLGGFVVGGGALGVHESQQIPFPKKEDRLLAPKTV